MLDGTSPILNAAGVACPVLALVLALVYRRQVAKWLAGFVPQKNPRKVSGAVVVGAVAVSCFIAASICTVIIKDVPIGIWASLYVIALLAWFVAWALLANES